ncbi:MAG: translation initiation factor IF-2 [Candidatus Zixiibacteriota bacterium]
MAKKRLYEVAKDFKISSNALLKMLKELDFKPKSHMSVATDEMIEAIEIKFRAEKAAAKKEIDLKAKKTKESKRLSDRTGHKGKEDKSQPVDMEKKIAKLSGVLGKTDKGKKKRFDKKKKGHGHRVDKEAVQKSFRATMATMGSGKKSKKYKRREKGDGEGFEGDSHMLEVVEYMTVAELANAMEIKPAELIAVCFKLGMMASINQRLDMETIETLALECNFEIKEKEEIGVEAREEESDENLLPRSPVVTVMGHVDHGKTSLLDYIRKTDVVGGEAGAITQHIGAYEVQAPSGKIVFIDTPGHEAFTAMRARGAQITDIVILVVAADDGVMPQTVEAIDHARAAEVPIIVAINKIDKPAANPDMIRQELAKRNLNPEEWGGKTIMVEVSAKTGQGIDTLLEMIHLQAEMLDLRADPDIRGQGVVIEAKLEKGRGPISTVIIQKGNVQTGDPIVAGTFSGHVRVMLSDRDELLEEVGPATPVRITGLNGVPQAGDTFIVVSDEREARDISQRRTQLKREQDIRRGYGHATLENIYAQIKDGQIKELRLVIKADVDGSAEVLAETLGKIATEEVRTSILRKGVGAVNESDVLLAVASNAIIIAFNVTPDGRARAAAVREKVEIKQYNIIYDVENDVRKALEGMLSPELTEEFAGLAEIRQIFKVPRIGTIAGCFVKEGTITKSDVAHVVREGRIIHTGKLSSLKRFKDDAREVQNGYECGIGIENFNDVKVGDNIEMYKIIEHAKKLDLKENN